MPETRASRSDFVQSLERGLAVIRAFDSEHRDLRLSDVAASAGLTRAAARRFLLTLVDLGYMRLENGRFSLRPRVLELGYAYLSSLGFADIAQPHMETLAHELNESSSVSVLDDLDIVYVVRVPTRRIMTTSLAVGTRLPAFVTSMGRVLLAALPPGDLEERLAQVELHKYTQHTVKSKAALRAELEKVAREGFAVVDQELEEGLRSIAVPIRDAAGSAAALNVSVHASRTDLRTLRKRFVPEALKTAAAIESEIRGVGGSVC
jgi:IclR family transcriptional regulator, pca regulon regulatory protein